MKQREDLGGEEEGPQPQRGSGTCGTTAGATRPLQAPVCEALTSSHAPALRHALVYVSPDTTAFLKALSRTLELPGFRLDGFCGPEPRRRNCQLLGGGGVWQREREREREREFHFVVCRGFLIESSSSSFFFFFFRILCLFDY